MYDIDEIYFSLSENIDEHRRARHWTIKKLSELTGSSYNETHNWISGARTPSFESLLKIANAYGISIDELIGAKK